MGRGRTYTFSHDSDISVSESITGKHVDVHYIYIATRMSVSLYRERPHPLINNNYYNPVDHQIINNDFIAQNRNILIIKLRGSSIIISIQNGNNKPSLFSS